MNTKDKIAVMQAYVDGATIQILTGNVYEDWNINGEPAWNWKKQDNIKGGTYRIKPEERFDCVLLYRGAVVSSVIYEDTTASKMEAYISNRALAIACEVKHYSYRKLEPVS